jgi:hypothetical protein
MRQTRVGVGSIYRINERLTSFNVFVNIFDDEDFEGTDSSYLVNGMRVLNGRIRPPAFKTSRGYTDCVLFSNNIAEVIYEQLVTMLTYEILPLEDAIKPICFSKALVYKFLDREPDNDE